MAGKKTLTQKILIAGAAASAVAGGIAAAVALSDKTKRKKLKKFAQNLKSKANTAVKGIRRFKLPQAKQK